MHELSLVESLIEQTQSHAEGRGIKKITLSVGVLTCADPGTLLFCFDTCKHQVGMDNTELLVEPDKAQGCCRSCGKRFWVETTLQPCSCGSLDIETQGGDDIVLKELEFA